MVRVQLHKNTTRLEDRQQRHHHLRRPFEEQADTRFRANPPLHQRVGQPVGAPVQIAVAHLLVLEDDGHRVRAALHLLLDERMETRPGRVIGPGVVPLHQQLPPLGRREQVQLGQPGCRRGDEGLEQDRQMAQQPARSRFIEPGPSVKGLDQERPATIRVHNQRIVGLFQDLEFAIGPAPPLFPEGGGHVMPLEGDHRFKERRPGRHLAPFVDPGEGRLLEGPAVQGLFPQLAQERGHCFLTQALHANWNGVDQQANHSLRVRDRMTADGAGGTKDDVVLAGEATEQECERALKQGIDRQTVLRREGIQALCQLGR